MAITITGPAGVTEGTAVDIVGTDFSAATADIQIAGGASTVMAQPVNSQNATAVNITPRGTLTAATLGVPVTALPFTVVDASAAGSTLPSLEVEVTNA